MDAFVEVGLGAVSFLSVSRTSSSGVRPVSVAAFTGRSSWIWVSKDRATASTSFNVEP